MPRLLFDKRRFLGGCFHSRTYLFDGGQYDVCCVWLSRFWNYPRERHLLLRIYPWYSSEATGKTICLSHVTLHGVAESVSSIQETNATDARLLQTIYYDICGVQLHSAPESGIYLEKNCYSDGRVSVLKKLK